MIEINDKKECCGCNACYNACPKNAIEMISDEYGFKYPRINESKCIHCNLCDKACPMLKNEQEHEHDIDVYAMYNKNEEERMNSSSGGIFILLAKEIINKGGIVFGASFDDNFNVHHIYADNLNELYKFQGSKYVQSDINNTYQQAKKFLEDGKAVLFTGTPCQIEGLKCFLKKDYENLFTADIICHGVPSPKVWNKYKEYRLEIDKEKPRKINFRNKNKGWTSFELSIDYENDCYSNTHRNDLYMQSFLKNTILRDSCYSCKFKKKYRFSDITLADFWGVNNVHPNMFDNKGTSLVLVNSEKGKILFESIKDYCIFEESKIEYAEKYNSAYLGSVKKDKNRQSFFKNIDNISFDKLVKKYTSKPKIKKRLLRILKKILKK